MKRVRTSERTSATRRPQRGAPKNNDLHRQLRPPTRPPPRGNAEKRPEKVRPSLTKKPKDAARQKNRERDEEESRRERTKARETRRSDTRADGPGRKQVRIAHGGVARGECGVAISVDEPAALYDVILEASGFTVHRVPAIFLEPARARARAEIA